MRVKLSLMGDMCTPQPAPLSMHEGGPCAEMPTPMLWWPGYVLQQNRLSKTVFHKSQFMALEEHDCGHMIPHLGPGPILLKLPLIVAFSKRTVMFSSSTVKADDNQIACTQINSPVALPMMTCGSPIPLPNSFPVFNWLHNVSVNLTVGDLVAGFVSILMMMAGEALIVLHKLDKGPLKGIWKELVGAASFKHFCLKVIIGLRVSVARLIGSSEMEIRLDLFSAYWGGRASIHSKRDGRMGFAAETTAFVGVGSEHKRGSLSFGNGKTVDSRSVSHSDVFSDENTTVTSTSTFGSRNRLETLQTQTTTSQGSVRPEPGGKGANSYAKTFQKTETATGQGPSTITSGGFQGTSTAQGDWGKPL